MKLNPLHNNRKRGASILLLSFFFMIVLFTLASALFQIIPAEFHAASRAHVDVESHYVANSGIQHTLSWLEKKMEDFSKDQKETNLPDYNTGTASSPTFTNINNFLSGINGTSITGKPDWTTEISIEPLQDSLGQKHGFEPRLYSVRSTAFFKGKPIRSIDVLLRQRTFASFALYTAETDPQSKFVINGKPHIFGPVHTNDYFRFEAVPGLWGNPNAQAYFTDVVSHAGSFSGSPDGNEWIGGKTNAPETNSDGGGYDKVFSKGRDGLRLKNQIELPQSTGDLISETWPLSSTAVPTDLGAHLAEEGGVMKGGLYIEGDLHKLHMTLDSSGNQKIQAIKNNDVVGKIWDPNKTKTVNDTSRPKDRVVTDYSNCIEYWPADTGSTGGVNGGAVNNCKKYGTTLTWWTKQVPDPGYVNIKGHREDIVYEVTEAPVSYVDETGANKTAPVGSTLLIQRLNEQDDVTGAWSGWKTVSTKVADGQPNGTIYVNGNIGIRTDNENGENGLYGIAKGNAIKGGASATSVDASGFVVDSAGNRQYLNKTIVTPLNKGINLAGDLLQFNQAKFDANKGINFESKVNNVFNWTKAALNPGRTDVNGEPDPELSPNNDHVLGLVTRDVWMKGRKSAHSSNGNDGFNDIYAVILAGVMDNKGNVSGGFGTWYQQRDHVNDGLGKFRVIGGVIQGTTDNNFGENQAYTHYWANGSVGYEASMFYDIEATRQRLFPTYPEFRVVRYLENSARK